MFSLRRLLAVAKKEFLEIKRNLLLFLVLTLGPVMLYLLYAYGLPMDIKNIPLGILDMDKSAQSRSLQDTFENNKIFIIKQTFQEEKSLKDKLNLSELRAGVIIPHNFGAELKRNSRVTIQALVDGSYPNHALISAGYIEAAVGFFNFNLLEQYFRRFWGSSTTIPLPIDIKATVWYNSTFNSNYFMLPGLFGLTLVFFPAVMAALSLTKEKETRSIINFYCSNITKAEYLIGKMLPYIIITYLQCLFCFAHAIFLMGVPMRGSLLAFIIAAFLFSVVAVGTGLFIGIFIHTQAAAILITTIITLTFTFIYSGIITPVICLSEENRVISNLLPITHFIDVTRKVMVRGASFAQVKEGLTLLLVSCFVFYGTAILFFKKRLG
jgi:ABC-type multidrug transport system permease subunit